MQYNEKAEIKGDFSIEARGSGALLVREKQQENLMIYSNLSMAIPEFAKRRDWSELDREIAKSLEVPYDQITLGDEEIAEMEAMNMEMASMQVDPAQQKMQLDMQLKQVDLQIRMGKLELDKQKAQAEIANDEAQVQLQIAKMAQVERLEMMKLEIQERIKLAELQTQYRISGNTTGVRAAIDSEKIRTERDKAAAATNTRLTEAQLKNKNLNLGYDTFG